MTRLLTGHFYLFPTENLFFDYLENDEKARHDKQQGNGTDEHTTDSTHTK